MQLIDSPLKMCLIMYLFSTATDNKSFKGLEFVSCRWQLFGTTMSLQWKCVKTGYRLVEAGFCSFPASTRWQFESSTNKKTSTHSCKHAGAVISRLFSSSSSTLSQNYGVLQPECSRWSYRGELVSTVHADGKEREDRKETKVKKTNEKARQKNI